MRIFGVLGPVLVSFALLLASCSGGGADAGADCASDGDCGSLKCLCVHGTPGAANDYVPGVCSQPCSSKADCESLGSDMSCAKDFCTGVNVCLQNYSGSTLP